MLIRPKFHTNSSGFSVGTLIVIILIVAVVFLGFKFVSSAQKDNKNQANVLEGALSGGDDFNTVESDEPFETGAEKPKSSGQEIPIRSVDVEVQALYVVLIAKLSGTFTGSCRAEVEMPNGDEYRRYEEPIERASSCRITVPRKKLEGSDTWRYEMSFDTSDGRAWGRHPVRTLRL